jgi:signal peptidase I
MKSKAKKNFANSSVKSSSNSSSQYSSHLSESSHSSQTSQSHQSENTFSKLILQLKKFWNYIWNNDSLLSWILAILVVFLLVRFIIYPVVGLALGTNLPLVAVISGSMEHNGDFDSWWSSPAICDNQNPCSQEEWYAQYNISYNLFKSFTLKNGFNKGDLILLRGKKSENIRIGDVLVFSSNAPYPIIHRVVQKTNSSSQDFLFETKGDANSYQITNPYLDETKVHSSQALGVAYAKIPYLGYLKLWLVNSLSSISQMTTTTNE